MTVWPSAQQIKGAITLTIHSEDDSSTSHSQWISHHTRVRPLVNLPHISYDQATIKEYHISLSSGVDQHSTKLPRKGHSRVGDDVTGKGYFWLDSGGDGDVAIYKFWKSWIIKGRSVYT